ncbi:MAG: hypothetical protein ACXVEE_14035, partial [Polyangiales bacterium]
MVFACAVDTPQRREQCGRARATLEGLASIRDMVLRAHSDVLVLVHVVFATRNRLRLIPQAVDGWLHDELRSLASRKQADLLAVGNADDHVH